jgi:hypothetical protein
VDVEEVRGSPVGRPKPVDEVDQVKRPRATTGGLAIGVVRWRSTRFMSAPLPRLRARRSPFRLALLDSPHKPSLRSDR